MIKLYTAVEITSLNLCSYLQGSGDISLTMAGEVGWGSFIVSFCLSDSVCGGLISYGILLCGGITSHYSRGVSWARPNLGSFSPLLSHRRTYSTLE